MYIRRTLGPHLLSLSAAYPALLVTGARQVGKTTLLQHLIEVEGAGRRYVSLDEFVVQALARDDPQLFLQRYPAPLAIDEVQHAPGLLAALKPLIDRGGNGQYWLTGSQHFPLMRGVSESLAGRVGIVQLQGLSLSEALGWEPRTEAFRPDRVGSAGPPTPQDVTAIFERIVRGNLPRLAHADAPPWESYYGSYVQTYLERDVRALLGVTRVDAFRRFLRLAAARVGQLLNYSDIARDAGVAVSTVREWISLLEATCQVYLLRPYFNNIGKRQIKTPKLYFRDTGLACYLTGWRTAETAAAGAMAGALLECFVVGELQRSYEHRGREAPLWFFRDKERREVDVLIAEDGLLFPVEIKLTASPRKRDLAGLAALRRAGAPLGHGAVLCFVEEPVPLDGGVDAVPVGWVQ